jgi:nitrogen fixation/metabolism regulation signal transduction histidine kinase
VFGARLKLRLMLMFGVIAVLPGALVYGVSVQFVTRSIESWFDVRVEKRWNRVCTLAVRHWIHCSPI